MDRYDVIVLGAGSGNTVIDERFAHLRVAMIEPAQFGGTCLNRGCIPSKMLVLAADHARDAGDGARWDIDTRFEGPLWDALRERVFGRTDAVARDGQRYREGLDFVDVYAGQARFVGPRTIEVTFSDDHEVVTLLGDQVVIATGSRPVVPDIPGLADSSPYTSDTVMRIEELPRRLAVLGGGYVGSEMAHVFSALGVEVTQIESSHRLLDSQDPDIARIFTAQAALQWAVHVGVRLDQVTSSATGHQLHLSNGTTIETDIILVATGRTPNSDTLGLTADGARELTGIHADPTSGRILVDDHQATTAPGVWALGDASTEHPLKHVANHEARVVQHNLLHPGDPIASDHRYVPQAVFSSPQVASVGLTETEAHDRGINVAIGRSDYSDTAYGWALNNEASGWTCKLIADRVNGNLIGAHIVGPQATTLIQPLIQAMAFGLPVAALARGQYWIHPAPTEIIEAALIDLGQHGAYTDVWPTTRRIIRDDRAAPTPRTSATPPPMRSSSSLPPPRSHQRS